MNKIFCLVLIICIPLQLLHAHHTYIPAQNAWELSEGRLGNAIVHFTRISHDALLSSQYDRLYGRFPVAD